MSMQTIIGRRSDQHAVDPCASHGRNDAPAAGIMALAPEHDAAAERGIVTSGRDMFVVAKIAPRSSELTMKTVTASRFDVGCAMSLESTSRIAILQLARFDHDESMCWSAKKSFKMLKWERWLFFGFRQFVRGGERSSQVLQNKGLARMCSNGESAFGRLLWVFTGPIWTDNAIRSFFLAVLLLHCTPRCSSLDHRKSKGASRKARRIAMNQRVPAMRAGQTSSEFLAALFAAGKLFELAANIHVRKGGGEEG